MAMIACKECGSQVSSKAENCPKCGVDIKNASIKMGCGFLSLIFLLLFFAFIFAVIDIGSETGPRPPSPEKIALSSVKLEFRWNKKFDNFMEVNFTVYNNGDRGIKDIEIECSHYSKSNTRIDSNTRTIFEIVKAKSQKEFFNFDMGFIHSQAHTTSCVIVDLEVI